MDFIEPCFGIGHSLSLVCQMTSEDIKHQLIIIIIINKKKIRVQELCASRGGRPGLPIPNNPYGLCGCKTKLNWNKGKSKMFPPTLKFAQNKFTRNSLPGYRSVMIRKHTHQHCDMMIRKHTHQHCDTSLFFLNSFFILLCIHMPPTSTCENQNVPTHTKFSPPPPPPP